MKILLYSRRNVGIYCLSHLIAIGHEVVVMTDDANVEWLAERYGCKVIDNGDWGAMGEYENIISIHGNKIIPPMYLTPDSFNIHPTLYLYRGANPIKRYIENGDVTGSVESHYMTAIPDAGDIIHQEFFHTGKVNTYQEYYDMALPFYLKCLDETLNKILQ